MSKVTWTNDTRKLRDLVPWEHNPRQIKKDEAARLVDSLDTFGQIQTIAIGPNNEVYDGHQRKLCWAASEKFGPDYAVDVRVASRELTERERQQLVVYLHRGTVGEWDFDLLGNFDVPDLLEWGFGEAELELAGFTLPGDEPPADPGTQIDRAAELQEKWGTKLGQVWEVESRNGGVHRVACGDCTDLKVVAAVMPDEKAFMTWTDPPYGVNYGAKLDRANPIAHRVRTIQGDDLPESELEDLIRAAFILASNFSVPGAALYAACPPGTLLPTAIAAFKDSGFEFRWQLVWVKDQLVLGRGDYHFRHENVLYGWKQDAAHYFIDDRTRDSVFEVPRPKVSDEHPTMKPVELIREMVENSSQQGALVYDPFMGSGSTCVACEQSGRLGRGIDILPAYVAVALERLAGMGLAPVLVSE